MIEKNINEALVESQPSAKAIITMLEAIDKEKKWESIIEKNEKEQIYSIFIWLFIFLGNEIYITLFELNLMIIFL